MEAPKLDRVTEAEYLGRELASETKSEYRDGHIVAMAGCSPRHWRIAGNLFRYAENRLRAAGKDCQAGPSDARVYVPVTRLYTYPDVTLFCGPPQFHPDNALALMNPTVLIEVLSKSTEGYDRGEKFESYQSLVSLQGYVLVAQSKRRVEHFRRVDVGQWLLTEAHDQGTLTLPELGIEVPLDEIYENVEMYPAD